MSAKVNSGIVVRTRIAPEDVMGVVDVLNEMGLYTPGMSFSLAVSMVQRGMLEAFREQGIIPRRQGFEYAAMAALFPTEKEPLDRARGKQFQVTKTFKRAHDCHNSPISSLATALTQTHTTGTDVPPSAESELAAFEAELLGHESPNVRRLMREIKESEAKCEIDPLNFSEEETETKRQQLEWEIEHWKGRA